MEHICRTKTAQTKNMNLELYWTIHYHSKTQKIKLAAWILFMFAIGVYATYITLTGWKSYPNLDRILVILSWGMLLYAIYRTIFQANIYAHAKEKYRQKIVGNKLVYTDMLFFDSYFCIHSALSSAKQIVSYSDVVLLKETMHYYIVVTTNNSAYAFDKNGFVDGTCEQAVQLLRDKGSSSTGALFLPYN